MLSLLLSLALQAEPIGWDCSAERTLEGLVYRSRQAIESGQRFPRNFRVNWMAGPFDVAHFVEWSETAGRLPDVPRTINFSVAVSGRTSRGTLRLILPDGTEQRLAPNPAIWTVSPASASASVGLFQSLDGDLNRRLWAARRFRAVVEDRRGRVLGALDMSFPEPALVTQVAADLTREVDEKLRDPANPGNACRPYGAEAYYDPV
jgi:hypothetical protein